jgi:hypothetical protein
LRSDRSSGGGGDGRVRWFDEKVFGGHQRGTILLHHLMVAVTAM